MWLGGDVGQTLQLRGSGPHLFLTWGCHGCGAGPPSPAELTPAGTRLPCFLWPVPPLSTFQIYLFDTLGLSVSWVRPLQHLLTLGCFSLPPGPAPSSPAVTSPMQERQLPRAGA